MACCTKKGEGNVSMSSKSKSMILFSIAILVISIGLNVYLLSKLNIRNKDMETMQKTISEQKYYPKYSYDEEQKRIAEALDEYQSGLYPNKKQFLTEVLSALPVWEENDINNSNYKMDQKKINKAKAEQREILIRVIRASNEYKLTGEIKDKGALSYVSDKKREESGWIPQKLLFEFYESDNYEFCYQIEPVSPEASVLGRQDGFHYLVHFFYDTKKVNGPNPEGLLQHNAMVVDKVDGKWMIVDYGPNN